MDRLISHELAPMTQDEKAFFRAMGERITQFRKDSNLTQVQLAEAMRVSQQTVAAWEVGRRGVPVAIVPLLARTLGASVEALIGEEEKPGKRGPTPKLQQQLERLSQLPKAKQRIVIEMLEGLIAQSTRA